MLLLASGKRLLWTLYHTPHSRADHATAEGAYTGAPREGTTTPADAEGGQPRRTTREDAHGARIAASGSVRQSVPHPPAAGRGCAPHLRVL
jgi:hypothetical protein